MGNQVTRSGRGYYARINGKPRWICGAAHTPEQAEAIYHRKAAQLTSGKNLLPAPAKVIGIITLHYVLGRWLKDCQLLMDAGKMSASAFMQYRRSAKRIDAVAGEMPIETVAPETAQGIFERISAEHGADAARRALAHLRTACRHAEDAGICAPVRLGRKMLTKLMSSERGSMKWQLYTPGQVQAILAEVDRLIREGDGRSVPSWTQVRAMILLALNGGYGAKELAELPRAVVDLERAHIDYRRGKTGAKHIVLLWPETVDALRAVLAVRVQDDLVFRTRQGGRWCVSEPKLKQGKPGIRITDHVNERFTELVKPLGLKIRGQGFYKLKHLHCSIADRAGDPHATFTLAGHELPGSKGHYVLVEEDRLRKVVEFIRAHLFNPSADRHRAPQRVAPHSPATRRAAASRRRRVSADAGPVEMPESARR
jgi:integrase